MSKGWCDNNRLFVSNHHCATWKQYQRLPKFVSRRSEFTVFPKHWLKHTQMHTKLTILSMDSPAFVQLFATHMFPWFAYLVRRHFDSFLEAKSPIYGTKWSPISKLLAPIIALNFNIYSFYILPINCSLFIVFMHLESAFANRSVERLQNVTINSKHTLFHATKQAI